MKSNIARQYLANNFSNELPSGGLKWHLRAFLRHKKWVHLKNGLNTGLADWRVSKNELLLVGPSAGWTLPSAYLNQFSRIHAIDLDPLAKRLFLSNHPLLKNKLHWQTADYLEQLPQWLANPENANTPVLFCNTLGQRGLHTENLDQALADFSKLQGWVKNHDWFSYHDRLSFQLPKRCNSHSIVKELSTTLSHLKQTGTLPTEQLLSALRLADLPGIQGLQLEVTDHCTQHLLPHTSSRAYRVWPMTPRNVHIIEMGFSSVKTLNLLNSIQTYT